MGWEKAGAGYWELPDLSGGLNKRPIVKIGDHQSSDCQNWYYWNGSLRNVFGASKYAADPVNAVNVPVTGVYQYKTNAGVSYIVATAGDKIKYLNNGVWEDITGALTITAGHKFDFCTMQNMMVAVNGNDANISWAGTGNAAALAGSPPIAKYCMPYNNYLMLGNAIVGGTPYPDRVYRSNFQNIEVWTSSEWWRFDTEKGSPITGMKKLGYRGVVYHENSISFFSGKTSSTFATDADAIPGIGAVNGQSIVSGMFPLETTNAEGVATGEKSFVYAHIFRGYEGYFLFTGSMPQLISDHISPDNDNINRTRLDQHVMCYYPERRQVWTGAGLGTSLTNNYGYIIDMVGGGFWPHLGFDMNCAATIKESGTWKVLLGGSDGYVRVLTPTTYHIDGANLVNYWRSKWFSITKPADMKIIRDMIFYVSTIGDYELNVELEYDLPYYSRKQVGVVDLSATGATYPGTYGTSVYSGSGLILRNANVGGLQFNHVRLKLSIDAPAGCSIEKIGVHLESLGDRRLS